jgi:hypothetical protein
MSEIGGPTPRFADPRLSAAWWHMQVAIDQLYHQSRLAGRPILPGMTPTVLEALWSLSLKEWDVASTDPLAPVDGERP